MEKLKVGSDYSKGQVKSMENRVKQPKVSNKERVYDFITGYIQENGFSPSIKEICIGTDLKSISSVYNHLLKLEDEGRIQMKRNTPRAIKITGYAYVKEV